MIDFVRNSKLKAFLSTDISSEDLTNRWANCIAHGHEYVSDLILTDIIRSLLHYRFFQLSRRVERSFKLR